MAVGSNQAPVAALRGSLRFVVFFGREGLQVMYIPQGFPNLSRNSQRRNGPNGILDSMEGRTCCLCCLCFSLGVIFVDDQSFLLSDM